MKTKASRVGEGNTFPFIDTLFDYGTFLAHAKSAGGIGHVDNDCPASVAIIGAGLSGMIAARELLNAGVTHVTLFEANAASSGGRLLSQQFDDGMPEYIAEMGAMRFPPSETGLFHYLAQFNIDTASEFPDPGIVDTEIHFQGVPHKWTAGTPPPELFSRVDRGWRRFLQEGVLIEGKQLQAPALITLALKEGRLADAKEAWQQYLDIFGDNCFYSALVRIFTGTNPPGGEQWHKPDDSRYRYRGVSTDICSTVWSCRFSTQHGTLSNQRHCSCFPHQRYPWIYCPDSQRPDAARCRNDG